MTYVQQVLLLLDSPTTWPVSTRVLIGQVVFLLHHCVAMSAAGHADVGNVTQGDNTQADNDFDDGLDNFHQTDA